jgi:hypothetical protein
MKNQKALKSQYQKTKSEKIVDNEEEFKSNNKTDTLKKQIDIGTLLDISDYEPLNSPNKPKNFNDEFFEEKKELIDKIEDGILLDGWLVKEGRLVKNWKKRWFEIKDNKLAYYTTKEKTSFKGEVILETCVIGLAGEIRSDKRNCLGII